MARERVIGTNSQTSTFGRLAFFNVPPSSGKTSLVESLQLTIAEPWFHLSLDDFRSGYSNRWWIESDDQRFELLLSGYLGSLREMALAGNDVVAEAVMTPERRPLYESTFGDLPILLIGVKCPLEVARRREAIRTDRRGGPIDLPSDYFLAVHEGLSYDLEVETSVKNPTELAAEVIPQFLRLVASNFHSHLR
jgi:chloramphenicol 3-O phosphotransferase